MAWLLVRAANMSNVNVGTRETSGSLTRCPSAAFCSTFQHRVFQLFQMAPDKAEAPLCIHTATITKKKPVQAKLAIIQQKDEFYPDSFIFFFKKYW